MRLVGLVALTVLILTWGCAAADRQRELEHQLRAAESERDTARTALEHERAKTAAFEERIAAESRNWETARAEVATLKSRIDRLTQSNAELLAVLEQRGQHALQRPDVPPSPLPAEVDKALLAFAEKLSGRVWYDRGRAAVSFANDRLFDSGSDTVQADGQAGLGELAGIAAMPEAREFEVIVVGHTDDTPITKPETLEKHPTNWHLSVHRALAVKAVLVSAGLPEARMGVMGYGPHRPVSGDPARNRRVEVFLVRKGEVQSFAPIRPAGIRP